MSGLSGQDRAKGGRARHRRVAIALSGLVAGMLGLAYAAAPLYVLFCQITGYDGTPRRANKPSDTVLERTVLVRLDANVARDLGWEFKPVQNTVTLKLGENGLTHYIATNTTKDVLVGTATFNVTPAAAGPYFNKLECFCFTEQRLEPGQSIDMPVSFFVDPELATAKDLKNLGEITLSYTFHRVEAPRKGTADAPAPEAGTARKQGS